MSLLEVEGLSKSYGGVQAARNVSFSLKKGELLALIGPNGAGKSTTFGMVGGQLLPDSGKIEIEGVNITGLPPSEIARHGVGRTFQVATIFASMTVIENVQTAIAAHRHRSFASLPDGRQLFRDEAMEVLSVTNMVEFADRPCGALSYGDVKRAELAIALAGNARLLLMDEPTAGMAPSERASDGSCGLSRFRTKHRCPLYRTRHGLGLQACPSHTRLGEGRDHRRRSSGRSAAERTGQALLSR
jgi:ABC-type branched-subunit amino acid transport system ATPase component